MAYIATGITVAYAIFPARSKKNAPNIFGAISLALSILAACGAFNVWYFLIHSENCVCVTAEPQTIGLNASLNKEVILIGCIAIFGISLVEISKKFFEKL